MTSRTTSLFLAILALNAALGSFAAPTVYVIYEIPAEAFLILVNRVASADIDARAVLEPTALEARAIVGGQVEAREYPKNRLVRRRLGLEPRHHHKKDDWEVVRFDSAITTTEPTTFDGRQAIVRHVVHDILVFLIHGKHRHRKHCPLRGDRRGNRDAVCTCKHRCGHREHHEHHEHEYDEYHHDHEHHRHEDEDDQEDDEDWKGWKHHEHDDEDRSKKCATKHSTTPKTGPSPSGGVDGTNPSPPDQMVKGGANETKSASSTPLPSTSAPGSQNPPQSEKAPTGQDKSTDTKSGSDVNPPSGNHALDASALAENNKQTLSATDKAFSSEKPPQGSDSKGKDSTGDSGLKSPADNSSAPPNAPSPSGKNTLVSDKPASGQGSDPTTPSSKSANPNGDSSSSFNTSAGAPPPPSEASSSGAPAPNH
jgi:hypothetical protein